MSWLPHFISPWTGVMAAALSVPPLILLYFLKLRRREQPVSSTLLWKKAVQDLQVNAPFQKLRRNLLLLLQLLLLLLLCTALARPISFYHPGAGASTIIMIDRSASMNAAEPSYGGRTRLEEAKRRARELVETMQRNATAMVIAFDDSAQVVCPMTPDVGALRTAIDSITPTDRGSRARMAFDIAEAQATYNPEQGRGDVPAPEAVVFSDGRMVDSPNDLQFREKIRYERIGTEGLGNVGIVAMSARRNFERPTQVQVFARLENFGPVPVSSDVQLEVAPIEAGQSREVFTVRGIAQTELPPQRWSDADWAAAHPNEKAADYSARQGVDFTLDLNSGAVLRLTQITRKDGAAPPDALAADDVAQVIVPPPKALSVLLVSRQNYFLEKVMRSLNLKDPAEVTPEQYEASVPQTYDLIIFDNYTPQRLPGAGNFIYFGSVGPGLGIKAASEHGVPVMVERQGVLDWQRDHPILKGLSLSKLLVQQAIKLAPTAEDQVLVEGTRSPLIVLHREGRSTHLVIAFDVVQSTWPTSVTFPYFMYNALQFLAAGSDLEVRPSYLPGDTPRISRLSLQQAAALAGMGSAAGNGGLQKVRLIAPDGSARELNVPEDGDFVLPPLDHAGIYRTEPPIPGFDRIAVNLLNENESDLQPIDRGPVGQAVSGGGSATRRRIDLWWWIVACGVTPLLLIEWWVYTRRVHL
jgi:hypothetical protein